jgi:DMSO/TMAO reductase YedYZ molybdopterin-dependent catalytic subunit
MECAGNDRIGFAPLTPGEPWGSGAVSTAIWRGTPLRELLAAAALDETCVELLFCGADGGVPSGEHSTTMYARSLPIDKALEADTLVAYEMNGQPIPAQHGGPVRLVVPGWYGMASVKWLERISALEQPFDGYFQRARYVLERPGAPPKPLQAMQVKAHIATPQAGECMTTGAIEISGMAWSGEGAIVRVEVRIDHTGRWNAAQLGECATAHSWQPWSWTCEACAPGRHVIQVRATDSRGNTQPEVAEWNKYGYVNNAIQTIVVTVVER